MKKTLLYVVISLCFGVKSVVAQSTSGNTPESLPIVFNGKEYIGFNLPLIGSLFYNNAQDVEKNTVKFDKILYDSVALIYDLRTDQLISRHPKHLSNLIVVKEFVDYFTIGKDTFVNFSEKETGLRSGYYLQIFNSDSYKSFAKLSKDIVEPKTTTERRSVDEKIKYFYKTPASPHFIPYNNIKKLTGLDKQHRKALKDLLRDNGFQYEKDIKATSQLVLDYLSKVNHH
jgi:hypothetical protein